MDESRKNAFRRVLYAAMLDFRSHTPVSPHNRFAWFKPWLWARAVRRLRRIQATADWLHNLASFAADDFDGFEERPFWREYDDLVSRFPEAAGYLGTYRIYFEIEPSDERRPSPRVREWGVVPSADAGLPDGPP